MSMLRRCFSLSFFIYFGVLEYLLPTLQFGPACIPTSASSAVPGSTSEDCLFGNVRALKSTPSLHRSRRLQVFIPIATKPTSKLPVLVYFHGPSPTFTSSLAEFFALTAPCRRRLRSRQRCWRTTRQPHPRRRKAICFCYVPVSVGAVWVPRCVPTHCPSWKLNNVGLCM